MKKRSLVLAMLGLAVGTLSACGGGGSSSSGGDLPPAGGSNEADQAVAQGLTISGSVVDGPIQGASVCLYAEGRPVSEDGQLICSAPTTEQGHYQITIPVGAVGDSDRLLLVATKDGGIKLVSYLGDLSNLKTKASSHGGVLNTNSLPEAEITHISTAEFAIADVNHDDILSDEEINAYRFNPLLTQRVAAAIKAVVDGGMASTLLPSNVLNDTLDLSRDAADGYIEAINMSLRAWAADPNNQAYLESVVNDARYIERLDDVLREQSITAADTSEFASISEMRNALNGTWSGYDWNGKPIQFSFDASKLGDEMTGTINGMYHMPCNYTVDVTYHHLGRNDGMYDLMSSITGSLRALECGGVEDPQAAGKAYSVYPIGSGGRIDHLVLEMSFKNFGMVWKD